jgi:iron(III) transport system permease protein
MRRALAAAAVILPVGVFAVGPIAVLVVRSLLLLRGDALVELAGPDTRAAIANTVLTSAGAAAIALALGLPLSVLLARTALPLRGLFTVVFTLPSAIPPFIWGMGWISLASPRVGYLNRLLGEGTLDVYGRGGIAFVLATAGLPLVVLAGTAALSRIDPALPLRALATVSVALALPALLSGAPMVFLFAASAFGVPYMLGVTASPPMPVLTTRIYGLVLMGGQDSLARALVLSAALLALATLLLGFNQALGRAARVQTASGKGIARRLLPLGRWRLPIAAATALAALVLVALPLGAVLLTSLQKTFGAPVVLGQLTLQHWAAVLGSARTLEAAGRSVLLAAGAAGLVCALGTGVALARKHLGRVGRAAETLASWPYAAPGTVLAIALLFAFSRDLRFVLLDRIAFVLAVGNTLWMLLVAYSGKYLALGARNVSEALAQVDPSLAEAARVCGAGRVRAFVDATLPSLRPAITAAFVLTFLTCATELTLSVLLVPTGSEVLGTLLFELQTYADPAAASVLACGFVAVVAAGMAALSLSGRRPGRP